MSSDLVSGTVNPETLYTKQQCIGGGSFGKVYKGIDRRTGNVVAIKVIDVENAEDEVDDIITEIAILSGMNSQYVTKYYGSYLHGSDLWIVMEFCSGGSCADLMKPGPLTETEIAIIIKELLHGLVYLHDDHKLHRDIKAANILVSATGQVKLADFGVSGQLSVTMTKKNTFVGTPFWMAPEVIKQSGYDGKADIWSLGITALELANGEPPYADIHPMKVLFLIPKNPPPVLTGEWSSNFKEFVELCLRKDPRERPTAKQLLSTNFIRKAGKPARLQELISRYQDWQLLHPKQDDYSPENTPQKKKTPVNEDLWDFGTVRPLKANVRGGGPALSPMSEAGANARNMSPTRKPVTGHGDENVGGDTEDTVRLNSPRTTAKFASQIPLPQSPEKTELPPLPACYYQQSPQKKSVVPQLFSPHPALKNPPATPPKQAVHQPRRVTPLARDYDEYIQRSMAADMAGNEGSPQQRSTPARSPVLPRLNLEIPPYKGKTSAETKENHSASNGVHGKEKPSNGSSGSSGRSPKSNKASILDGAKPAAAGKVLPSPPQSHLPVQTRKPLPISLPEQPPLVTLADQKPLPAFNPAAAHWPESRPGSSSAKDAFTSNDLFYAGRARRGSNPDSPTVATPDSSNFSHELPVRSRVSPTSPVTGSASGASVTGAKPAIPALPAQGSAGLGLSSGASAASALWTPAPVTPPSAAPSSGLFPSTNPASPNPQLEITALHGVIIPALEAAVARRAHQLNIRNREESQHAYKDPTGFMERRRQRQDVHENVRRVVHHLIEDFKSLDQHDSEGQVGMGGEVMNFLEGFLEEILVRVEPSDDI